MTTDLDQFFEDRVFEIRDLDQYDLAEQMADGELAPLLLIHHGNAAVAIVMEPLDNGVHIEVHPFWLAQRAAERIDLTVVASAENTG